MKLNPTLCAAALAITSWTGGVLADTVKISGAATVFNGIVSPAKAAVEKSTGHALQLASSNTGKGLAELIDGGTDIAMVGEPLESLGESAASAGKKLDVKSLQYFPLGKEEVVFTVHPSNTVTKLSPEQLRDIHSGKIGNWKDVGGKDLAIVVYTAPTTSAVRAIVKRSLLGGLDYGSAAKAQSSTKRVADMVAADPAGIGATGKPFVEAGKTKTVESKKIELPLALATLGAPKPAAKAVIDAYTKEAKSL